MLMPLVHGPNFKHFELPGDADASGPWTVLLSSKRFKQSQGFNFGLSCHSVSKLLSELPPHCLSSPLSTWIKTGNVSLTLKQMTSGPPKGIFSSFP